MKSDQAPKDLARLGESPQIPPVSNEIESGFEVRRQGYQPQSYIGPLSLVRRQTLRRMLPLHLITPFPSLDELGAVGLLVRTWSSRSTN